MRIQRRISAAVEALAALSFILPLFVAMWTRALPGLPPRLHAHGTQAGGNHEVS